MSPLRIIILAILFYIGYRLISGSWKKSSPGRIKDEEHYGASTSDVLMEDPVCLKLVPKKQAVTFETNGDTYYFCSRECCREFRKQKRSG
ncbi:MAG: TRASH domain protein [Desulfobacterales bacterium]|nr:MAG: TRASH domain protein [Deltaproteobacteria bacterium]PIE63708.1 MAG: TRASH domain protein [Desulfobacterales bacterium]